MPVYIEIQRTLAELKSSTHMSWGQERVVQKDQIEAQAASEVCEEVRPDEFTIGLIAA